MSTTHKIDSQGIIDRESLHARVATTTAAVELMLVKGGGSSRRTVERRWLLLLDRQVSWRHAQVSQKMLMTRKRSTNRSIGGHNGGTVVRRGVVVVRMRVMMMTMCSLIRTVQFVMRPSTI